MALNFPPNFVELTMECVKSPSFSLMINGSLVDFFKGKKGLMQEVTSICMAYIWSGKYYNYKPSNVNWDKVCSPKDARGLGVRYIIK